MAGGFLGLPKKKSSLSQSETDLKINFDLQFYFFKYSRAKLTLLDFADYSFFHRQ